MSSLNQATLIGRLGADPEIRQAGNDKVANMRIATSERWKDRTTGEPKERTEWHSIVVWGKLADISERFLRKGSQVCVQGQLQTRKWQDQKGNDRYSTEVVLRGFNSSLVMLDAPQDRNQNDSDDDGGYDAPPKSQGSRYEDKEMEDQIPF